jgi:hypothetical protein
MRFSTWTRLVLSGALLLGSAARSAGSDSGAKGEPVLELMSLDPGNCTLELSWPWGAMAVNHVLFNDHRGPFKAVVESAGRGVRITFDGWGRGPFVASADKVRMVYSVAGRKEIDFTAEAVSGGIVRVRPVDRPVTQGRRIVIGLGQPAANGDASVAVEGRKD